MTGVSIGCQMGADHEVLRSWMIVVSTETVVRYVRRDYASGIVGRSLMAFLRDKSVSRMASAPLTTRQIRRRVGLKNKDVID